MLHSLHRSFKYSHTRRHGNLITKLTTSAIKLTTLLNFGSFKSCLKQNHSLLHLFWSEVNRTFCKKLMRSQFYLQVPFLSKIEQSLLSCSLSETSNFSLISCLIF